MFGKKKKYLEYHFDRDDLNDRDNPENFISDFIAESSPKSSCWWSSLKVNILGIKNQFEYVKQRHSDYIKNNEFPGICTIDSTIATAKQCPAIVSTLRNSFLCKSPADIIITITPEGGYLFNSSNDYINIQSHSVNQFHTDKNNLFGNKMNLKFMLPVQLKTDNVPWIFTNSAYHNDTWFDVVPGVIDGNYTKGQPLFINTLVDIPKDEPVTYEIKTGDVLAYIWLPEKLTLKKTSNKFYDKLIKRKWSHKSKF